MNASFAEPEIPPRLRRPLAAVWISLGLHAAVIALVQVAPPSAGVRFEPSVIEARLVPAHDARAAVATPPPLPGVPKPDVRPVARLAPDVAPEALPVAKPVAPSPPPPAAEPPHDAPPPPSAAASGVPPPSTTAAPVPAATLTSSVDLTYYSARELDVQPRALRKIVLDYPEDADRRRLSGKVVLRLKLEADGRVSDIELVSATHPDLYDKSKLQPFLDTPFSPAQKNGRPVRAMVLIEVNYDWEGRQRN